ncbi:MAG: Bax inhibitor-1/YccA family protein [Planctomycetota bacterium]
MPPQETNVFESSNPVLTKEDIWSPAGTGDVMTVQGVVTKTIFALLVTIGAAAFVWRGFFAGENVMPFMVIGGIGAFAIGILNMLRGSVGPITTTLYAGCEGLFIGGLSAFIHAMPKYHNLPLQAVLLTFCVMFAVLAAYKARIVQATEGFKMAMCAGLCGISLVYLVSFVLSLFGSHIPYIHESGPIGIGFSVFVVGLAALSLVLDFDLIERGARSGAPKSMEWYAAFGLLVTLIWLYIEILRLLMKLQDRGGGRRISS